MVVIFQAHLCIFDVFVMLFYFCKVVLPFAQGLDVVIALGSFLLTLSICVPPVSIISIQGLVFLNFVGFVFIDVKLYFFIMMSLLSSSTHVVHPLNDYMCVCVYVCVCARMYACLPVCVLLIVAGVSLAISVVMRTPPSFTYLLIISLCFLRYLSIAIVRKVVSISDDICCTDVNVIIYTFISSPPNDIHIGQLLPSL